MEVKNPEGAFWRVKCWWRVDRNTWEGGGDFVYTPGDTWESVLKDVIKLRQMPHAELRDVSIELRGDI